MDFSSASFITPHPEQAGMLEPDQKLDQRTDLYSLGVVLYEMATERMPFSAESPQTYFLKQVSEEVQPINPVGGMPKIPYDAEQFILKLLKRDRSERFADAEEALAALAKLTGGSATPGNTGDIPLQQPAKPLELDLPPKGARADQLRSAVERYHLVAHSFASRTPPQTRVQHGSGALSEMIPETVIFDPKSLPDLGSAAADEDATVFSDSLEPSRPRSGPEAEGSHHGRAAARCRSAIRLAITARTVRRRRGYDCHLGTRTRTCVCT